MNDGTQHCMVCFEDFTEDAPCITENHIGCGCRFFTHEGCWESWNIERCLICRKEIVVEEPDERYALVQFQIPRVERLIVRQRIVIQEEQHICIRYMRYCMYIVSWFYLIRCMYILSRYLM